MEQLREWYAGLEAHDQKVVQIGGVFFAVIILVFGLLKPLTDSVGEIEGKITARQKSTNEWQKAVPYILANKGNVASSGSNLPLSTLITTTTTKYGLRVSRVQEKSGGEIQVWFDSVVFNDFLRWTVELQNQHQISVNSVNVRSKNRDGLSSIDIKISK